MLEARYIALGLVSWICTLSPQRIIIGGGVMQQLDLFGLIRRELSSLLNGYIPARELTDSLDTYVVAPKLDDRSGVLGALIIAEEAVGQATSLPPDPDAQKLPGKNSEVP
jgi:fructokinase